MSAAYIQVHFRLDFLMDANNMIPYQKSADLSLHRFQKRVYSKTCVKWPLKNRQNKDVYDKW